MRHRSAAFGVAGVLGLLFLACGGGDEGTTAGPSGTGGIATGGAGGSGGGGGLTDGSAASSSGGFAGACAVASGDVATSPVDVIIAIDQSASMGEETAGVIANLNTHLTAILKAANIDYKVIFVAGVNGLPTGPEYFQAKAGVNSSDALTLLLWTYDGNYKAPNTCNKTPDAAVKWGDKLRYEGQKVFIVVTDDDPSSFDCANATASCTANCAGCASNCSGYCPMFQCPTYADKPAAWGGGDFPSELYKLAPAGMFGTPAAPKWVFHSIVPVDKQYGPTEPVTPLTQMCNANGNTGETSGVEYQKLSVLSGGIRFPSCDTDYSPVFQSIAATIIPLACKFDLTNTSLGTPDPKKTNVEIDYGDGAGKQVILKDDTAPCEAGANGWQFTDGTKGILLCGAACDKLKQSSSPKVSITLGCDTQTVVK